MRMIFIFINYFKLMRQKIKFEKSYQIRYVIQAKIFTVLNSGKINKKKII